MPIHHPLRPGVDCAPDDFDSFEVMGVMPIQRLPHKQPEPWNGVERRRHLLNGGAPFNRESSNVPVESARSVERRSLTLSAVMPAVEAGPSSQRLPLEPAGACGDLLRVSTHAAQCHDVSLTDQSPQRGNSGVDPVNEGVAA